MAETSQGNRRLIRQAEKHHPKSHDVRPRSSLAPSGNASSSTSQDKTKTRPTSHTSPKKDLATRTHTPCLKRKCRAAKPGGHRRVGRRCHMLEGMYSRNNKRLLALLMFQSMRRDNLRGVFGVPRGDCEFLILRGASLSSSLGQSRRAQWWAPSPPPHARSSLERSHPVAEGQASARRLREPLQCIMDIAAQGSCSLNATARQWSVDATLSACVRREGLRPSICSSSPCSRFFASRITRSAQPKGCV